MANVERIEKLISVIQKSKKFESFSSFHCVIGIAYRKIGKRSKEVSTTKHESKMVQWFSNYFDVDNTTSQKIWNSFNTRGKQIRVLESLIGK